MNWQLTDRIQSRLRHSSAVPEPDVPRVLPIKPSYTTQSDTIIGVVNSEAILADVIRIYIYIYIYIYI